MTHARSPAVRAAALAAALVVLAGLIALGVWQVERLAWKRDLIARVDGRLHAAPIAAPSPDVWARIRTDDAYTRVTLHGHFDNARETPVQALTDLGAGFWILTPLHEDRGFIVLVNRGFAPADKRRPATRAAGQVGGDTTITGLLRVTEPRGAFLRTNAPAAGRWYSRDVAAIAAARGLGRVAPYFVDADAASTHAGGPIGGLTVVRFPNHHLQYAITWFAMAAMLAGVLGWLAWRDFKPRSP